MKYPKEQFNKLVNSLSTLRSFCNLKDINPARLHYIVYQQHSSGQRHNALVMTQGTVTRAHSIGDDYTHRILPIDDSFELYPDGCDDRHIITAINKAIKELE